MCWGATATVAMVGVGSVATGYAAWRREPKAITLAIGYFTLMEVLQALGYLVVDRCDSAANQLLALLSVLHITFQPFFINALAMELLPARVSDRIKGFVYLCCAMSAVIMLVQLYPFAWAGRCQTGTALCGASLCVASGEWHIAWHIPFNGLLVPLESAIGTGWGFPTYLLVVFLLPFLYGAWRLAVYHFLAGPMLAGLLTANPNEIPAVWCLFSVALVLIAVSPTIRQLFKVNTWFLWPGSWQAAVR